ncbi:hypothetical protein A2755_02670 [Candidatus Wolfebacteria bacterium RIFCSPHIGHO2_01_FULL_48_22]|uniref:Uncharacterized protein n=2 Tax=Candidatus Wolfeibacteriota TaxID=1752735 RepID=A0A1F8DS97_9BACT|nr:MAG: hypothetical protein A2755_02670 [Candidatus Wolfebacteria bacterium RIFCSPHIGHO2_01_FULL_48_22]OGM92225.1 MAG: hypothetical protein A2935_00395 [Candidatus Wolfebacteria bacterium RIFCSPLOWO2_01_FULL_47_17b]
MKCCIYVFVINEELSTCAGGNHYFPLEKDLLLHVGEKLLIPVGDTYASFMEIEEIGIDLINERKIYYGRKSGEYSSATIGESWIRNFLKFFFNYDKIRHWWEGEGVFPRRT